ncbi:ArnT family glycosyltransferase [Dokdonella sp. MW10]|uniref:ArnT family glycosyltransferase n=1 Tax=Dokdonella sp. MW10 TaxID=2992926 RepID=UPI003F7D78C6
MHHAPTRHGADAAPSRTAWAIAVSAWLLANLLLLWLYYEPSTKPLIGDEFDYNRRALAWLAGQPVAESHIWPPGQTAFIAAIYALAGPHVVAVQVVQIGLLAGCALLLARLASRVFDARTAWYAGALFLLNPGSLAYAHWLWPEVTHLACLLGALALLFTVRGPGLSAALAAGVLTGLALLFKSLLGAFWPLLLVAFASRGEGRWRVAWMPATAFVAGIALATAPALWKGYQETGRPIIADSSIYNLHVGLRDMSRSDYIDEAGAPALKAFLESGTTPQQRNAAYTARILDTVGERGLATLAWERLSTQYFRLFSAKTLLVSQLPGEACAGRLGAYAATTPTPWLSAAAQAAHALTLALAAFGIALWRRWDRAIVLVAAALLLYQLALYSGLHVMARYVFQMMPFLCLFGAPALAALVHRGQDAAGRVLVVTPLRLVSGCAGTIVLLGLAFLGPWLDGNCR